MAIRYKFVNLLMISDKMRLQDIEYDKTSPVKSDGYGYSRRASYSKRDNAKKGLYAALASVAGGFAIKTLYDSVHFVKEDYDAIVSDKFTGKRKYVRDDEGWLVINPFVEKVIPIHERYGNTTLEGMFDELKIYKSGKESTALYHVKLKDDADLEALVGLITPYMGRHFLVVAVPKAKFAALDGLTAGMCYDKNYIEINEKYMRGGVWENSPLVYHTTIHENVHTQGSIKIDPSALIINETTVEVISGEIDAEISANGFKKFEASLYDWLEGRVFQASYLRAREENKVSLWSDKIKEIYGNAPDTRQLDKMPTYMIENYALFPYVKIKLAMTEGNEVYDLLQYDTTQNPEGGNFKIDDLAVFLNNAEKTYGSAGSLETSLDVLLILQCLEHSTSKK